MLYIGLSVFAVYALAVYLVRRLSCSKDAWSRKNKYVVGVETLFIAWTFWSIGATVVPLHRKAAWLDGGGVFVTAFCLLVGMSFLFLAMRSRRSRR